VVHNSAISQTSCHACKSEAPARRSDSSDECTKQTFTCYKVVVTLKDPQGTVRSDQIATRPRQRCADDCDACYSQSTASGAMPSAGSTVKCYHTDDYSSLIMDKVYFASCIVASWVMFGFFMVFVCCPVSIMVSIYHWFRDDDDDDDDDDVNDDDNDDGDVDEEEEEEEDDDDDDDDEGGEKKDGVSVHVGVGVI
jgi:hypothetical protein